MSIYGGGFLPYNYIDYKNPPRSLRGVRIFVPPSLSLIVENLTLRVFGIVISENLGSIS